MYTFFYMRFTLNYGIRLPSFNPLRKKRTCFSIRSCLHSSRKQRTFCHTKIFIDNRKETEYAGFMTHLHLLLHIVTLDIEALVVP